MISRAGFAALCVAVLAALAGACAKPRAPAPLPALKEAYLLMDRGENAKAVVLLEKIVVEQPESKEARVLLASAYLGEAGVDVYRIHDTFKDLLFNQPLERSFFGGGGGHHEAAPAAPAPAASPSPLPGPPPIAAFIHGLDAFLGETQRIVGFLNRFPDVERAKWPLLERALEQLADSGAKDVMLYRVFIRVVYLKAFLTQELISDSSVGTKKWVCAIELETFRGSVEWMIGQLNATMEDYRGVFPKQASTLSGLQAATAALGAELSTAAAAKAPTGTRSSVLELQRSLRSQSGC